MDVKRTGHSVWRIEYHFVWIPRYRHAVLRGLLAKRLYALLTADVPEHHPDWQTIRLAVEPDHVHWLMSAPPKYAPSDIMRVVKAVTSQILIAEFPSLRERYWDATLWSDGFFVSAVGPVSEEAVKHYIQFQQRSDLRQ